MSPTLAEANHYSGSNLVICSKYTWFYNTIRFLSHVWKIFCLSGPPSVPILSFVGLSGDGNGTVNVTVNWTLIAGDSGDFYLISITTNAPLLPYGGLFNVSVTQHELTGFIAGYEYNITVRGVNCGSQEGNESEPLTIRPQGTPP